MKKLILLFLLLFTGIQLSSAADFDPGELFHHWYNIDNKLNCSIKITKIRKCWDAPITSPSGINPFVEVKPRSGVVRTTKSGCFEYDPNYIVPANTVDTGWDIDFLTKDTIEGAKVDSTFQYWYDVIGSCNVSYERTSTNVSSGLVGTLCGNNIAENNIMINSVSYTEQCDDGKNGNNDGCSDLCVLEPVDVNLSSSAYNSNTGSLSATLDATKTSYSDYVTFQDGRGNTVNNPTFPRNITYPKGTFGASVSIISNYAGPRNPNFPLPTDTDGLSISVTDGGGGGGYCGNGVVEGAEQCDDGNNIDGDGCSSTCTRGTNPPGGGGDTPGGGSGTCGDGHIDPGEECDNIDRSICSATCTIINTSTVVTVDPEPDDLELVGGESPISDSLNLRNTTDYPQNFGTKLFCVQRISQISTLPNGDSQNFSNEGKESLDTPVYDLDEPICGEIGIINGHSEYNGLDSYTTGWQGRVDDFNTEEYVDNTIRSWIDDGNRRWDPGETQATKKIRVAAPTISNISSGSVYGPLSYIGNISKILDGIFDSQKPRNKNFLTVSIDNNKDSYVNNINNATIVEKAEELGLQDKSSVQVTKDIDTGTTFSNYLVSDMVSYRGHDDILILDKGNLIINSMSDIEPSRTYIVEEGNIIINSDIEYSGDYSAFIAKNGDIRISENVKDIKGIFMTMQTGDGFFSHDGVYTRRRLVVDGALYGNVDDIVKYRTYIEYDLANNQLNVGTIVDLTSEILKNPPPLLSKFLNDYIELRKVAD